MNSSLIGQIAKKAARARLMGAIVALLIAVGVGALTSKQIINAVNGPYIVTAESLDGLQSADETDKIYITIEDALTFDTGYYEYTFENGRENVQSRYGAVFVGETILLVKTGDFLLEEQTTSWTGVLTGIPDDEYREVVADMIRELPELDGLILPVMLNTKNDIRIVGYGAIAIIGISVLLGLWWLSRWLIFSTNPDANPVNKKLQWFGDPSTMAQQIDMEMSAGNAQKVGSATITRSWVVMTTSGDFKATRHQDIVWLYQKVVRNRYGKTFYASIHDKHGQNLLIQAKEKDTLAILQMESQLAPWALMDHDNRIQQMWNKQRNDLVTAVEQRKSQVKANKS